MTKNQTEFLADMTKNFETILERLIACKDSTDLILAWPDKGLAVRFDEEGKPEACGVHSATAIQRDHVEGHSVMNGVFEKATVVVRGELAKVQIERTNETLRNLPGWFKAAS